VLVPIALVVAGVGAFVAVRIAEPHRASVVPSPAAIVPAPTAPAVTAFPARITVRSAPLMRTVSVVVSPPDAHVQIDGFDTPVQGGLVTLTAGLGTVHRVRLSAGRRETAVDVTIAEEGAVPPKVDIAMPPARGAVGATPAATSRP
jgi:hypothetical protein